MFIVMTVITSETLVHLHKLPTIRNWVCQRKPTSIILYSLLNIRLKISPPKKRFNLMLVETSGVHSKILVSSPCASSDKGWVGISGRLMLIPCSSLDKGWSCIKSVLVIVESPLEWISLSENDLLVDDLQLWKVSLQVLKFYIDFYLPKQWNCCLILKIIIDVIHKQIYQS